MIWLQNRSTGLVSSTSIVFGESLGRKFLGIPYCFFFFNLYNALSMSILLYVNSCLALLFSFLLIVQNISFISIFATILGMGYAFLILFFSIELLKKKTQRSFWLTRSLSAYLVVVMMIVFMVSRLSGQTH